MPIETRSAAADIRLAREESPKMRERDLAAKLGISEGEFVAAFVGDGATKLRPDVDTFIKGAAALGKVMALTRNESAVHEKIGVYDKPVVGEGASMLLGADIDLRIFPKIWAHAFAVEKRDGEETRRSIQFFDASGEAVHKLHLRPSSDIAAYSALVAQLRHEDQSDAIVVTPRQGSTRVPASFERDELRQQWRGMGDVHQFPAMLRQLKLTRHEAVRGVGDDIAWMLDASAASETLHRASAQDVPIMCFVGSRGCIQIHSGPVKDIRPMGPWINVLDETFHLHLRTDHIREVWAVRKPVKEGHVTSVEAYGADGELIIQFFGQRKEGRFEREDWRVLAETLPRIARTSAA
jgi:putative hemin transport protein